MGGQNTGVVVSGMAQIGVVARTVVVALGDEVDWWRYDYGPRLELKIK